MKRLSFELSEESIGEDRMDLRAENDDEFSQSRRELVRLISRLMDQGLTQRQKQCLMLYYFEGLTQDQIAGKLGVSVSTVSRTVRRARNNLARELDGESLRRIASLLSRS